MEEMMEFGIYFEESGDRLDAQYGRNREFKNNFQVLCLSQNEWDCHLLR